MYVYIYRVYFSKPQQLVLNLTKPAYIGTYQIIDCKNGFDVSRKI